MVVPLSWQVTSETVYIFVSCVKMCVCSVLMCLCICSLHVCCCLLDVSLCLQSWCVFVFAVLMFLCVCSLDVSLCLQSWCVFAGDGLQDEVQRNSVSTPAAAAEVISLGHLQHGREEHAPESPCDWEQELQGLNALQLWQGTGLCGNGLMLSNFDKVLGLCGKD